MPTESADPTTYDILILGGGSGGYSCALRGAQLGLRIALIERAELGGTCLHRGCIPTKALLHTAEVADSARTSTKFGVRASFEEIDMPAVHQYKKGVVQRLHRGLQGLVDSSGVDYITGEGVVTSAHTVQVGQRTLTGRHLVLATGSAPRELAGVPLSSRIVTSDQAIETAQVPKEVVVLGGGVIGVEFASIFCSFGSKVTVVEARERIVPVEEPAISAALTRAFTKRGIAIRTGVQVHSAVDSGDTATVVLSDGKELKADLVLVAVGRVPVSDGVGYAEVGVALEDGYVTTDARLRTGVEAIYAVGDLVPGPQLAHRGFAHGIFVAEEIAGLSPTPISDTGIPRVTYCEPEIVSIGLTEAQVHETYSEAQVAEIPLGGNGKSQILGTNGFVKVVRSTANGPVLGIHMIGARMAEHSAEAQLILNWEALPEEVAALIHAHPTQNEAIGEAHLALAGKPLHSHA